MLVSTPEQYTEAVRALSKLSGPLVVDTETTGLEMFRTDSPARVVGIAIGDAERPGADFYFAFRHGEEQNLPIECMEPLRQLLKHRIWLGHNLAFDSKILKFDGFVLPTMIDDTIIAAHLCNENEPSFALKELATKYLGADAAAEDVALRNELRARKLGKGEMWKLPASLVAPYALADIDLTRRLRAVFMPELARWGLLKLYREVCEFSLSLVRMELRGLKLDREEVHRQIAAIGPRIADTKWRIEQVASAALNKYTDEELKMLERGEVPPPRAPLNINSPTQLRAWLKLPKTDKQTLLEVLERDQREDVRLLLEYRALFKAASTYFEPFLAMADAEDRLHTSYKVHGTVTGRLSSSNPNLQNASRDQMGRAYSIRRCFVAPEGKFLAQFDYSSIEPRVAAHYSGDEVMRGIFFAKHDYYTGIAKSVLKKDNISKDERTDIKTIGLMTIYGGGSHKAAKKVGLRHE
jgi:DNA polymerase-1